jgi:release factor glutamine methyltransferase
MFVQMTIKETYRNFLLQVQSIYNLNEASVITDWVFEKIANIQKSTFIRNPDKYMNEELNERINNCLLQLMKHKPIQYILGEVWFYKMKLKVNEHVLIPRPETEELVEWLLATENKRPTTVSILDIGTGSGCISIALKKYLHSAVITAIDVSANALTVAKENAANYNMQIQFLEFDFLDESKWSQLPMFDIIISNPPYIPVSEKEKMRKNVTEHEPGSALFVPDNDPLLFYKKIAAFGKDHLNYDGKIFVETHEDFGEKTASFFKEKKYAYVDSKKDMYGKDRMIMARY